LPYSGAIVRTLVDIPNEDLEVIGSVTAKLGISRAEFVRRALTASLVPYRDANQVDAFGILKGKLPDGMEYQEKVRGEW
jgi:metal-responsive CopG/Arc/MetJ family transcriptional regulator